MRISSPGFTLVEMAIVLVIIGVLAGGILMGKDLIHAAQIRSTLSQWEKYSTAEKIFESKYGAIPGDISPRVARTFGFYPGNGTPDHGDDNGLVYADTPQGEALTFWRNLSDAKLVDNVYGVVGAGALDSGGYIAGDLGQQVGIITDPKNLSLIFPPSKIGEHMFFLAYSDTNGNHLGLFNMNMLDTNGIWGKNATGLSPLDAYTIDLKMDDGQPAEGIVLVTGSIPHEAPANSSNYPIDGACMVGRPAVYNLDPATGANTPACSLQLPF